MGYAELAQRAAGPGGRQKGNAFIFRGDNGSGSDQIDHHSHSSFVSFNPSIIDENLIRSIYPPFEMKQVDRIVNRG